MMRKTGIHQIVLCGLIVLITKPLAGEVTPKSNEGTARAAIIARFEALQNISVDYQVIEKSLSRRPKLNVTLPNGLHVRSMVEPQNYHKTFSFLRANALWESTASKETVEAYKTLNVNFSTHTLSTSKAGRLELLEERIFDKAPSGIIEKGCWPSFVDVGLGLRAQYTMDVSWLTKEQLQAMPLVFNQDHQPCLSETLPDGKVLKWTFLPDHGYALGRYESVDPPGAHNVQPYVVTTSQFKVVDQIDLPYSIVWHGIGADGSDLARITASIKSYKVNDPANVEDRYSIKWPKGMEVHDRRSNRYVVTTQANQVLDDKTIDMLLEKQERER